MSKLTRRDFIRSSMAVGAGLAMVGPASRVLGANDDLRLGVIGVGGQGGGHMNYFSKIRACGSWPSVTPTATSWTEGPPHLKKTLASSF